jgi:hypothetical protein
MTGLMPYICVDCGTPGKRKAGRGRPRRRCERCAEALTKRSRHNPPQQRLCPTCAGPVEYGSNRTYCAPACGVRANSNRSCTVCGDPTTSGRRTCSETCCLKARSIAGVTARFGLVDECLDCRVPIVGRLRCPPCADLKKATQYVEKARRRRVLKRGGLAEHYTLAEIAQRDRHRCQLCRRKVDLAVQWPDPKSPSIDHVIPVTEGGDDTKANVQLAHLGCNSSKGARGSQQLALVG